MSLLTIDPLDSERDELYSIYRKGLITRHITQNGRFLDSIALESIDDYEQLSKQPESEYINVLHSVPFGKSNDGNLKINNLKIAFPKTNIRHSVEIDPSGPVIDDKYTAKPCLWVPMVAPIKYPGSIEWVRGVVRKKAAPWLPQSFCRRKYAMQKCYYVVCSGRTDNPCYYGGMALAAFSLEAIYEVSPHSIEYARKLVEGFLAMEMNGKNGYLIRYKKWHTEPGQVKQIRGASSEELLGFMLGIMFYLKAENKNHPMYAKAFNLRSRILDQVSASRFWSYYEHPFMVESFWVKHYELPFYASMGIERGNKSFYEETIGCLTSSWVPFYDVKREFYENLLMDLVSVILVLGGDLSDYQKESWAGFFLRYIYKHSFLKYRDGVQKNAFMGTVGLLVNQYMNEKRDCLFISDRFKDIFGEMQGGASFPGESAVDVNEWEIMIKDTLNRIYHCKSLDNEIFEQKEEFDDHWQHNLPLLTIIDENGNLIDSSISNPIGWKSRNPHRRLGADIEWKEKYPQWWRKDLWKFYDYIAWARGNLSSLSEIEYSKAIAKRYSTADYLKKEVVLFRNHHDNQIEGAGQTLLFLRMLLTYIDANRYPPPKLVDKDVFYPVLPFRGVEPLEPKFLHYEYYYHSGYDDGQKVKDYYENISLISFLNQKLIVTAFLDEEGTGKLISWRMSENKLFKLNQQARGKYNYLGLRKIQVDKRNYFVIAELSIANVPPSFTISVYALDNEGIMTLVASKQFAREGFIDNRSFDICVFRTNIFLLTYQGTDGMAKILMVKWDSGRNEIEILKEMQAEFGSNEQMSTKREGFRIENAFDEVIINTCVTHKFPAELHIYSRNVSKPERVFCVNTPSINSGKLLILKKKNRNFLLLANIENFPPQNETFLWFLKLWEINKDGSLNYMGKFPQNDTMDESYLLRDGALSFQELWIAGSEFGDDGGFLLAGKSKIGSGSGLVLLYGGINNEWQLTIWDWNCFGSGKEDSVKFAAVGQGEQIAGAIGAVTLYVTPENYFDLVGWRFGVDFDLRRPYRVDPGIQT